MILLVVLFFILFLKGKASELCLYIFLIMEQDIIIKFCVVG